MQARSRREIIFSQVEILEEDFLGDFPREMLLPALWGELGLEREHPAFASFCLDAALMCEADVVASWMKMAPRSDAEVAISTIEFYWRRRLKVDPGWKEHGPAWSNRVIRAKRRALKMMCVAHDDS
jgi:hypothetical protein